MRSSVEIVAERDDEPAPNGGPGHGRRTVLRRIRAGGHFAVRETFDDGRVDRRVVHLVGTAAGPLGGDTIDVAIRVGEGASLAVRSAAATIVLPGPVNAESTMRVTADVADRGHLDLALQPAVICAGARHAATITLDLRGTASARILEQTVLGRSGEQGGDWTGRTAVTRDGAPLLRHCLRSAVIGVDGVRAIVTELLLGPGCEGTPVTVGSAVALPLAAGGLLVTSTGSDLVAATEDLAAVRALAAGHESRLSVTRA